MEKCLPVQPRAVRSFVLRQGRLTPGQNRALSQLWPKYGLNPGTSSWDFDTLFQRKAARILEIGTGNGHHLLELAAQNPHQDFLGIEVHRPGIGQLLSLAQERGLNNIRIIHGDAMEILSLNMPAHSLEGLFLLFPDPWPKKRHHKRRIVNEVFVRHVAGALHHGGFFAVATDWADYARHIEAVMANIPLFVPLPPTAVENFFAQQTPTKYEQRGIRSGREIQRFMFKLNMI